MKTITLRDIIKNDDNIHYIKITKVNKSQPSTWTFTVTDSTAQLNGVSGKLSDYQYQLVTLQRGNCFFRAYKIFYKNTCEYYVDPKLAMFRTSAYKYIELYLNFKVFSNDISLYKDLPSFKYMKHSMIKDGVDNYLDMCVKYGEYSAVGTGLTRNIRNIIVFDIDVDCTKPDNQKEIDRVILKFAEYGHVPDFYIQNHETKHVQLQWLIKDCNYKCINWDLIKSKVDEFEKSTNKYQEVNITNIDFTKLTPEGINYRKYTRSLTYINDIKKFGDKKFTFWKAKNFYTALLGEYQLELKMPYVVNGEIRYRTREEMFSFFNTKYMRDRYFSKAPTMEQMYQDTLPIVGNLMDKLSDTTISKIDDEPSEKVKVKPNKKQSQDFEESRNNFIFTCTRDTVWNLAKELGYRDSNDIYNIEPNNIRKFKAKVKKQVKQAYTDKDEEFCHTWPGTSNISEFTTHEFNMTFNNSFNFSVQNFKNKTYTNEQRQLSLSERQLKKDSHMIMVDYIKQKNPKLKNTELLKKINYILSQSNHKEISNTTLKRYLSELKQYTPEKKKELYDFVFTNFEQRKDDLLRAKNGDNKKQINLCSKRVRYLDIPLIDKMIKP
jgi:hypothetical protein